MTTAAATSRTGGRLRLTGVGNDRTGSLIPRANLSRVVSRDKRTEEGRPPAYRHR